MNKFLLTSVLASATLGMTAASPANDIPLVKANSNVTETRIVNSPAKNVKRIAPGVTQTTVNGLKKLHIIDGKIDKMSLKKPRRVEKAQAPEGFVLYESFEDWNGQETFWTPEGWTVEMRGDVDRTQSWTPSLQLSGCPDIPDGNYYYAINYSDGNQDEWLISPEVEIAEGHSLSFWVYFQPAYLFNWDCIDFDKMEFIGEPQPAATLQIWAQPEGGEWVMIHDYFDDYKSMTISEIYANSMLEMEKRSVSLEQFAGKKVKIAFRYVGTDGDTMFIDAVGIGYPKLDGVSYMEPFSALYWGFDRSAMMQALGADIAMYPVYEPITWTNMSDNSDAKYEWTYVDPTTGEQVTESDSPDFLSVTYIPDYSSEVTMKNNLITPPVLTASAKGATPGSYQAPYALLQAGGKPERMLNDGTDFKATLFPFGYNASAATIVACDDPEIGDMAIPVFGYNEHSDEYWRNYSLNGEDPIEGDFSHLEGIANLFIPSEAPLVVNGITAYGWGAVAPDAEFTATIYAVNEEMDKRIETFTEIASATLKGAEFLTEYPDGSKGYMCLPFDFKEPVVIRATEEHPAFFIMLTGFRSDKVEYFAPVQSAIPDPNYMCLGYILHHINMYNHTGREEYSNMKPMVYKKYGEYVDPYASFAIGLDAEYPWLTTDATEIDLSNGPVEVKLGSYYDGSKLTVECPAGVEAEVTGRYNNCVLKVSHNAAEVIAEGNLVVKGPGVEVSIPVKEGSSSSIDNITSTGNAEVTGMFDLNGRRVNPATAGEGIYVVKYSDGTARKTVVKK